MQRSPTLYKIRSHNVANDAVLVETTEPANSQQPHILFCCGFHSNMRGSKAEFLFQLCHERGWGFTRFDYRGHGESDAAFENCNPTHWLEDTLAVIDQLQNKLVLVGSSMGAWLATNAILQRANKIQALLTIAAAPDFPKLLLWPALSDSQQKALIDGQCVERETPYDTEHWRIRKGLFDGAEKLLLLDNNESLDIRIPVRMLHGTADTDVPWHYSQQLLDKLPHSPDAELILINGADHRLSTPEDLRELQNQLEYLVERVP